MEGSGTPVVCFGQQNWDYCWTAKQQLCTRLAERGRRVLYVDPDPVAGGVSAGDTVRSLAPAMAGLGLREERPGLHVWTHVHAPPLGWRINQRLRGARIRAVAERLRVRDGVALSIHPSARPFLDAVQPRARVYYAVDEMTGFTDDVAEQRRIRRDEDLMLRASDVVLAVSPRLHERFDRVHPHAYLLPNGADVAHFSPDNLERAEPHDALRAAPGPVIGLVGQIDQRVDQALLVHVARARPDWRLALAGRIKPGVDVSALEAEPNILLLGYQDYADLPRVLRTVGVCMVPYHLTPLTHGCNPLKVWEYLATGRPVVATPLDSLKDMRQLITLAEGHEAFLAALDEAVRDAAAGRDRRLAFARANGWDGRVTELERHLEQALEIAAIHDGGSRALVRGTTIDAARGEDEAPSRAMLAAYRFTRRAGLLSYGLRIAGRALRGRPARVRRILVARRSRLGDLVVMLPMLRALRRLYPDAHVTLGVQPGFLAEPILRDEGSVDAVRTLDVLDRPSRAASLRALAGLFLEGYDLVLTGATFFLLPDAFLTGAPRIVGLDDGHPLQRLCDDRVRFAPRLHEAENNLALVETLGGIIAREERIPSLAQPDDSHAKARRILDALNVPTDAELIVMHPGAQKPSRRWPGERFAELAATLLSDRPRARIVLTGVPDEAELTAAVRAGVPEPLRERVADAAGRTDLDGLFALLAICDVFVCNDTGTMHVARALDVPLVALLGPENDLRWGPHPLGFAPAISLRHQVPCAPCLRWDAGAHWCMRSLSVAEAAVAVRDVLGRPRRSDSPIPLERRARAAGWRTLDAMGHTLPPVTAALVASMTAGDGIADALERSVASLEAQDYPAIEVVVGLPDGVDPPPRLQAGRFAPRLVRLNGAGPAETWAKVLRCAGPGLVAPARAGHVWDRDAIGLAVAQIARNAGAVAADPHAAYLELDRDAALEAGNIILRNPPASS